MMAQFRAAGPASAARLRMVRRYGWGSPTEQRVLNSAASSVTLILQDEFQPFERNHHVTETPANVSMAPSIPLEHVDGAIDPAHGQRRN
jgi:hypothetical protein